MQQNQDPLPKPLTSRAWSPDDPIDHLLDYLKWDDPVLKGQLSIYKIRTLEDLLQLPSTPVYESMPTSAYNKIVRLIDQAEQLLPQQALRFEEETEPQAVQQPHTHSELEAQLASLAQRFSHLGTDLLQMANEITTSGGILPSDELTRAITTTRDEFIDLRNRILERANTLAVASLRESEEMSTLRDLRLVLHEVAQAEEERTEVEQRHQRALQVLDRVLSLVYVNHGDFPALEKCQGEARALRHAVAEGCWPDVHPAIAPLNEGKHKFAELLTLSEQWGNLEPGKWQLLQDAVKEAFGPELSTEAARGHLIIPPEAAGTITSVVPEPGEKTSDPGTSPAYGIDLSVKKLPEPQVIPKNTGAESSPVSVVTPSLPEGIPRDIPSSQQQILLKEPSSPTISQERTLPTPSEVRAPDQLSNQLPFKQPLEPERNDPSPYGTGAKYERGRVNAHREDPRRGDAHTIAGFEGAESIQQNAQRTDLIVGTRIDPVSRGGRPHGPSLQNSEISVKRRTRFAHARPEIVCWKREQRWLVALEVPEEFLEQPDLQVRHNAAYLVQDDFKEDCWLLRHAHGQVVISWNEDEESSETPLALGDQGYLLFKLSGPELHSGHHVTSLAHGAYLIIVPETWECVEEAAEANPREPEFVSLERYQAYFYAVEAKQARPITFATPEGKRIIIQTKTSQFELVGDRLPDVSQGIGPLFCRKPPQLRALDRQVWTKVGTMVLGEEGSGKRRWRMQFQPKTESQEQDFPSEVAAREGGWYFVRIYDTNDKLLDSLDFRFIGSLKNISVSSLGPIPSEDGHKSASIAFLHEHGCNIQLAYNFANSIQIERHAEKTIAVIPPYPLLDETLWLVGSANKPQTQVTVLVERLWWAIGEDDTAPATWQDRPLTLMRHDFTATSSLALWLRFPNLHWVDKVFVGFAPGRTRSFPVKVQENTLAIPLRDFSDTQEIDSGVGRYALHVQFSHRDTAYTVHPIILLATIGCRACHFETLVKEEALCHIVSDHIHEYFQTLTYEEIRKHDTSLPPVIYKCPYCSFYAQKYDIRPTTSIADHVERVHIEYKDKENVSFRVVSDVDEIRENVIQNLPLLSKCVFCDNSVENENRKNHLYKHELSIYKFI